MIAKAGVTMYKTYSHKTSQPISIKRDIKDLPFDEIDSAYKLYLADKTEEELSRINEVGLAIHRKRVAAVLAARNASTEENPEDVADFHPIDTLDPETLAEYKVVANEKAVIDFVDKYGIVDSWKWLGPQLLALLGNYKLPDMVDGKYVAEDFLRLNVTTAYDRGLYKLITKVPRGRLMKNQTDPDHLLVCALVPLYMAAHKRNRDIKFTQWENVHHLVDKDLYQAMTSPPLPGPCDNDELLAIRRSGLTYVSKARKELGQTKMHNPATYHMLTGITSSVIGKLPKYAKAMLCQIWCAHPDNRSKYMILDPYNWDNTPDPLVSTTILKNHITTVAARPTYDELPWDA